MTRPSTRTFDQRLADGVMIGAEGYVFELERRGYVKAGPYVPEVILDAPDALRQLHREFLRAGADVMVALTYYAHREKLRDVGRDGDLEEMNRQAVRIANEIAAEGGALVAGNICNTWCYDPANPKASGAVVREQYREQLGWAVEEGVDFVISETNDFLGEALIGLEVCQELGLPAMVTLASVQPDDDLRRRTTTSRPASAWPTHGAAVVGLNCSRGPATMLPLLRAHPRRRRHPDRRAAGALPHRRARRRRSSRWPTRTAGGCSRSSSRRRATPASRWPTSPARPPIWACGYIGICCGGAPHYVRAMAEALGPRDTGQPLLAGASSCTRCSGAARAASASARDGRLERRQLTPGRTLGGDDVGAKGKMEA